VAEIINRHSLIRVLRNNQTMWRSIIVKTSIIWVRLITSGVSTPKKALIPSLPQAMVVLQSLISYITRSTT